MVKNHLKRIAAPSTWALLRKSEKFVTKPKGSLRFSLPAEFIVKQALGIAKTRKEAKAMVQGRHLLVDGRPIRDLKHGVSIMSVIGFADGGDYRVLLNSKGRLFVMKIGKAESKLKPCKVVSKVSLGSKFQFGFHDGRTLLAGNDYGTNDTVVFSLPDFRVVRHLKLAKGAKVYLIAGANVGNTCAVEDVKEQVTVMVGSSSIDTLKRNVFVIDDSVDVSGK